MKKLISVFLLLMLVLGLFSGCVRPARPAESGKLRIVCTIFPIYDWVRQILGEQADQAELTMLLDNGVDLHSYQPTAADMMKIADCDLFLYVGGESDRWVEDALAESRNKQMVVVNLMEVLGDAVKAEETVEGMEHDHEEHEDDHEEDHGGEHEEKYDEHVWLSLRNAKTLCSAIADALSRAGGSDLAANADAYCAGLDELDARYQAAVDAAPLHTLLFGDRFPFRYLTDDYGLDYYAAFAGCSAETEASFETIVFLAGKLDELGLHTILKIESSDNAIPDTIRQATAGKDQQILTLDSMQSVTSADVSAGVTYLSIMEQNLAVLTEALSNK